MRKKSVNIILGILLALVIGVVSFFVGYKAADKESETFYATITDIRNTVISVQGVEMNDINYRGEFDFEITGKTELMWRGTPMTVSELHTGDCIAITFTGDIQEIYPAHIVDVTKVQLLEDEK